MPPGTTQGPFSGTFPGISRAERGDPQEREGGSLRDYEEEFVQSVAGGAAGHGHAHRRRSSETFVTERGARP